MNLRQFAVTSTFAAVIAAFSSMPAFAADAVSATPDATTATNSAASPPKKAVRAANRAFSKTVQKALDKNRDLSNSTIAAFGNAQTGRVTLAGQIASQDQDGLAVATAKKVAGVTSVSSNLTLRTEGGS